MDTGLGAIGAWWWWTQLGVTWALVGLIWTVQRVIYPQMSQIPASSFREWHREYTGRMGQVVGPLMGVELLAGWWWILQMPSEPWAWVGGVLIVIIWLSTVWIQIPLHRTLARGVDRAAIERLVVTNWIRTVAWSIRGLGLLVFTAQSVAAAFVYGNF